MQTGTTPQIVSIVDDVRGSEARILVNSGFNCFSWRVALKDAKHEALWAHPDFVSGNGPGIYSGIPLLFPFPGRIRQARYTFAGREYQLPPNDALGNALHGLVLDRPWRIVEQARSSVVGEFQASVDDDSLLTVWPSDFRIRVRYEISEHTLRCGIQFQNMGSQPMPCGIGLHPYFRLPLADGSQAEDTQIFVPSGALWEHDNMLPSGRIVAAEGAMRVNMGEPLAHREFDASYTRLQPADDGQIRTWLHHPSSRRTLLTTFDPAFQQCIVYTPPHREAICIEPFSCPPDAIRLNSLGIDSSLIVLLAGESKAVSATFAMLEGDNKCAQY